jgi:cysteine-rich repeat protein
MRFRTIVIAAAFSAGLVQTGAAFAPHKGAESPIVANGRAPRAHRDVGWRAPATAGLAGWQVQWDRDTGVPLRMWGPRIAAPNAQKDPAAAEASARAFLAAHLAVLAPGATLADLTVLANVLDGAGDVRSVTFAQRANGLRVVGGAIGFSFKHDQLIMVSSTALPNVSVRMPGGTLPAATLSVSAATWLGQAGHAVAITGHGDRVIVPIVRPHTRAGLDIEYRVAETVTVESTREAGRWNVWLDAGDATPIARESTITFASGSVLFDVSDRYPGATRTPRPAPNVQHLVDGVQVTATDEGVVTWAGTGSASVTPGLVGPLIAITNKAGVLVSDMLTLAPGGSVTWSHAADELADAQISAFVFASTAKQFAKDRLNPDLAFFGQQLSVNVNENQTCNAFSTGDDIHFFKANAMCQNTGRIADVVYHEFGHSVHAHSIIPGQGAFDTSLSEGLADTLAASITGDHGMGRGFFFNTMPLRDLDPAGIEKRWPDDADGEPHDEGEIIGETLWDLRTALEAKLGPTAGLDQTLKIYYGIMQRASDIPSSYPEALVADDDDGNLANGTPNQCEINAAFGPHGLADPAATLGLAPPIRDNFTVSFTVAPPTSSSCPPPQIQAATLSWSPRGGTGGEIPLAVASNTWSADIPAQPDGTVVLYHVKITLDDGSAITYPQNPADPEYQFYVGAVTTLWCSDFENGLGDWTHAATPVGRDEWEAGPPLGIAGDPKAAHGGANVLGIDLGSDDGVYRSRTMQHADSPEIDLGGNTNVRLQYWRWLNSEDGEYDSASISANDQVVWTNFASTGMSNTEVNHTDKEWRFQDVDLSAQAASGKIKLSFALNSDPGLQLGGWNIDDVCLVIAGPSPTCGNGTVDTGESCDDGNHDDGDGCSSTCAVEACAVSGGGGGPCDGGGCCSAGTHPAGPIALSLLTLGLVFRRRRRVV